MEGETRSSWLVSALRSADSASAFKSSVSTKGTIARAAATLIPGQIPACSAVRVAACTRSAFRSSATKTAAWFGVHPQRSSRKVGT